MNTTSRLRVSGAALLALAGVASAQYTLAAHDRRIDLGVYADSMSGQVYSSSYFNQASDPLTWSDSHAIATAYGGSTSRGSVNGIIDAAQLAGSVDISAVAPLPNVDESRSARGLGRVSYTFLLSQPTPAVFDAQVFSGSYGYFTGPGAPVTMRLSNISTNQTVASIYVGWSNMGEWTIGDPVHLVTTLPAGAYELVGQIDQWGSGLRGYGGWTGVGNLEFNLMFLPAPGAAGLALAGLVTMSRRPRRGARIGGTAL